MKRPLMIPRGSKYVMLNPDPPYGSIIYILGVLLESRIVGSVFWILPGLWVRNWGTHISTMAFGFGFLNGNDNVIAVAAMIKLYV